jgi:hypothetical protein
LSTGKIPDKRRGSAGSLHRGLAHACRTAGRRDCSRFGARDGRWRASDRRLQAVLDCGPFLPAVCTHLPNLDPAEAQAVGDLIGGQILRFEEVPRRAGSEASPRRFFKHESGASSARETNS